MRVPFLDLVSQNAEVADEALVEWERILRTSAFIGGEAVSAFERSYADFIGTAHCVGVGNGTDAVELALRAVGVAPGDEVIVPVNTFIATAEAVTRIGAVPVFVDVDPDHLLIDPRAVEAAITARTRAIVPVHLYGQVAPVEQIVALARPLGISVVEDAAQAQGASSSFGRAGALADAAATSFYPGKNLGAAGDAGAVTTDDDLVAERVRVLSSHGSARKYVHDVVGVNSRLDAVQAVVLTAKLRRLDGWNAARRRAADRYEELLCDVPGLSTPKVRPGNEDIWHLYVVQVDERERVLAHLDAEGVSAAIHYPTPLHLTGAYADLGYARGRFPVAERAAERILSLPMFPHLGVEAQEQVAAALGSLSRTAVA